jgi:hypothetical protein
VLTFKDAYAGTWKNADTILPLHQAFGLLGESSQKTIGWLTDVGLPALKKSLPDAFGPFAPAIIEISDLLLKRLGPDSARHL